MQIKYLETQATPAELAEYDLTDKVRERKLILQVDGETEIVVIGFGGGNAKMLVRAVNPNDGNGYDPAGLVGQDVWDRIAEAIVWAEPTTIAHLVMDTINNQ